MNLAATDIPATDTGVVLTSFEAIADALVDLGVDRVFGLMGDDTVRLVSALIARGVGYGDARHENAAIAMAVGYASATSRLGVCVLSRGPGTTNGLTAAVNASRGDASVLIITGDEWVTAPANTSQLPDAKALDVRAVAVSCNIPVFTPRTSATIRDALRNAVTAANRRQTALLTLPRDLIEAAVTVSDRFTVAEAVVAELPGRAPAVAAAAEVLAESRRPLIIAGAGAWESGAGPVLEALAERLGGLLATTLRGKDMFAGHPYDLGIVGSFSHSAGRRFIDQADTVLVFGATLNRYTTNGGTSLPEVPLIHVDRERSHIGRYHPADLSITGDARLVAEQLLEVLPTRPDADKPAHVAGTRSLLADFSLADDFESTSSRWTIDPRELIMELDRLLPVDRAVVTDNGNFFGFVPTHIAVPTPDRFKLSSDFAVIGLGFGTALGAAIARPGVATTLFIGDGGLLMSLGELETLARLDVPLLVVVMNDSAYGAERHFLELRGFAGTTAQFPDTDFAGLAETFGIEAATVRSVEELRALGPQLADRQGPLVLDCKVTSSVAAPFLSEQLPGH